jgi:hypothetical protein
MTTESTMRAAFLGVSTAAALGALLLGGCAGDSVDPVYSENAIRGMLAHGSTVPLPSDLPKVSDSDWCTRVNLVLDNPNLSSTVKQQYADAGRGKNCAHAAAAQ